MGMDGSKKKGGERKRMGWFSRSGCDMKEVTGGAEKAQLYCTPLQRSVTMQRFINTTQWAQHLKEAPTR